MAVRTFTAAPYHPSAPRTGAGGGALFRLRNMLLRGTNEEPYLEAYNGSLDLSEVIPADAATGTLTLTSGNKTIVGVGTSFKAELRPGQFVLGHDSGGARSSLLVVRRITSDTSFESWRAPDFSAALVTARRLPVLFDMNGDRATCLSGRAIEFDRGTILSAGSGVLRRNGAAISASLTLSRTPKISLYDSATGTYTHFPLGMGTGPAVTCVEELATGTKNMAAGEYGLRFVWRRKATRGFNLPGAVTTVTLAAANSRVKCTDPGLAAATASTGADCVGVYMSAYNGGVSQARNGPWRYVKEVKAADISGGFFYVEALDSELGRALTFDDDAPAPADTVDVLSGYPQWISSYGRESSGGVSQPPGPVIQPAKPYNIEAVRAESCVPLSPPQDILGSYSAMGRLYLMTASRLAIAQFTSIEAAPLAARSFWKTGFANAFQLAFVHQVLYGAAGAGPTRSAGEGTEGSEDVHMGAKVEELYNLWIHGHILLEHDPRTDSLVFFHAADSRNAQGYWTTRCFVFSLRRNDWSGEVLLSSATRDMIVSGVAAVGNRLTFLAGGRTSGGAVEVKTYNFDDPDASEQVTGYAAWQFSDSGVEDRDKTVGPWVRATGRFDGGVLQVHGAGAEQEIDVDLLESGSSSLSGDLALADSSDVVVTTAPEVNVSGAQVWTVRFSFDWDGSGNPVRLDEVAVEYDLEGVRR